MTASACRVGCGAGFAGDRIDPVVDAISAGAVDYVGLECLAERTLMAALRAREAEPARGFDRRLRRRLAPLLPVARRSGVGIVTNLGGANPLGAGHAARVLAEDLGLRGLRVAVIVGDDVLDRTNQVCWDDPTDAGDSWLGVHAYLGSTEVAAALRDGADLVITGRTADSALFAAPIMASGAIDDIATATTAGHLLECSGQLTGGNLATSDRDPLTPAQLAGLAYPIARVSADQGLELHLQPDRPGRLDALTCTLQLLYEVHDPAAYVTPDAVLDFTQIEFEELSRRAVRVTGARSVGRPQRLKVVGFRTGQGSVADIEIGYAGSGAITRARAAAEVLAARLDRIGVSDRRIDLVGVDSILGAANRPHRSPPTELRVHVSARCPDEELADAVEDEVYCLTISGPAGGACLRSERRPLATTRAGLIDRNAISVTTEWLVAA